MENIIQTVQNISDETADLFSDNKVNFASLTFSLSFQENVHGAKQQCLR